MLKQFLLLTLKSVRYRPVRSWLTILGIVIGIMLVVIIFSLGAGIQRAVTKTLQMFGSDFIVVMPGKETNPLLGLIGGQKFKDKDLLALENIKGVEFVEPEEVGTMNLEYKGEKKSTLVHGVNWEKSIKLLESSQGMKLEKGQWPENDADKEAVFGYRAANNLFKRKIAVGEEIVIKSKRIKMVGYFSEVGEQMVDNIVFISLDLFRDITGVRAGASSANVKILPGADINLVAKQIKYQLSKQEVVRDFSVLTPEKADRLVGNVLSIVEIVLVAIALISLVVGAVGIMNTMYTSVLERTKQIGIMKALGASRDGILSLFLIESGTIGLIGGVLGIIFGIASAYFISVVAANFGVRGLFSFAALDFSGFLAILMITFVTGVVAGVLPARQAAKMEPAEALRYE